MKWYYYMIRALPILRIIMHKEVHVYILMRYYSQVKYSKTQVNNLKLHNWCIKSTDCFRGVAVVVSLQCLISGSNYGFVLSVLKNYLAAWKFSISAVFKTDILINKCYIITNLLRELIKIAIMDEQYECFKTS